MHTQTNMYMEVDHGWELSVWTFLYFYCSADQGTADIFSMQHIICNLNFTKSLIFGLFECLDLKFVTSA